MAFGKRRSPRGATVTTTTTTVRTNKPTLKQRLGLGTRTPRTATTTPRRSRRVGARTTAAPRRKTSIGDKVSGAMLKLKGTLTHRPGEKAAGTRRMHGTDGRGSRRYY